MNKQRGESSVGEMIIWSTVISTILIIFAMGVKNRPEQIYTTTDVRSFEIVGIRKPKHFSVTVLDLVNHNVFDSVGRSKHCNSWEQGPKLHSVVRLTIYYYYMSDDVDKTIYYEVDSKQLNSMFCG